MKSTLQKNQMLKLLVAIVFLALCLLGIFDFPTQQEVYALSSSTVATVQLGSGAETEYSDFATAWNTAVGYASTSTSRVTVKLYANIAAVDTDEIFTDSNNNTTIVTTTFGTGEGFGQSNAFSGHFVKSGGILVPAGKYITLDLNGKTINRMLPETKYVFDGQVICVEGDLILNDSLSGGKITGGNAKQGGGVKLNGANASFTMNSGAITENFGSYGGGVGLDRGTFTFNGGTISNNKAKSVSDFGGGICNRYGTVRMNGGTVSGNYCDGSGGGVYNEAATSTETSVFIMTAGSIKENITNDSTLKGYFGGSGVYNGTGSTFTMSGGSITDNISRQDNEATYLGSGVRNDGIFNLSGNALISSNKMTLQDSSQPIYIDCGPDNVHLTSGKVINISGTFTGTVGVSTGATPTTSTPVVVTSGWTSGCTGKITSDNPDYSVSANSSLQKTLNLPVATVTFNGETVSYLDLATAWNAAVAKSSSSTNRATFKMLKGWSATSGSFGTGAGFGINGTSSNTGNIYVPSGKFITIEQGNYDINRKLTSSTANGFVIYVKGNLILSGTGWITGGNNASVNSYGGGVCVEGGNLTINNTRICNNTAYYGGGVCVRNSGTVTFNSGRIYSNAAVSGGVGGGVCIDGNSTFTMAGDSTGTQIYGNNADGSGGGVGIIQGTFTMTGGKIYGNNITTKWGAGVFINNNTGKMNISGYAIIENNYLGGTLSSGTYVKGDSGTLHNVFLPVGTTCINVSDGNATAGEATDKFTGTFGITTFKPVPALLTSNWGSSTGTITSDKAEYNVNTNADGEKVLGYPAATVSFDANGNGAIDADEIVSYGDYFTAWNVAVAKSSTSDKRATVKLLDNWSATSGSFGTGAGFGTDGSSSNTGNIYVPAGKYITLDLNGKTINRGLTVAQDNGCVLKVDGNLILTDSSTTGKLTGGYNSGFGGGVFVSADATFTMDGGTIKGNTASGGGGLYTNAATTTVNGGAISGNVASDNGGGIYVDGGNLTIDGATMQANKASNGGGVYNNGTVYLNSGSIIENYSGSDGGGVYNNGTLNMTGGYINNNKCEYKELSRFNHGAGVYNNGVFNLSGKPYVSSNKRIDGGDIGNLDNVYLPTGKVMNISGSIIGGALGVSTEATPSLSAPVVVTSGWTSSSLCAITSDNYAYVIGSDSSLQNTVSVPVATVGFDNNGNGSIDANEIIRYGDFTTAWNKAVSWTSTSTSRAIFKLLNDWTADTTTHSFGTGENFSGGYILAKSAKYITLDLNGKTIDRGLTVAQDNGYVLRVEGNLILTDSSTTVLANQGKLTGGYNTGSGGGVFVKADATFTMNGGTIKGNKASGGGGLYINAATTTVNGGEISGNVASDNGGGIYVDGRTLTISGGTITGNNVTNLTARGGGIYYQGGTLNLSGNASITDNFKNGTLNSTSGIYEKGTDGRDNNLYIYQSYSVIDISDGNSTAGEATDKFTGTVGVSTWNDPTATAPITLTRGWTADCTGIITSDNTGYIITENSDSQKILGLPVVSVAFDLNGDGDTLDQGEVVNYVDFETAWNAAIGLTTSQSNRATVKLYEKWKASSGSFGTGAGFGHLSPTGTQVTTGGIRVPSGKYITLDLNGKTIDRVLTSYTSFGQVINVEGNLILNDSASGGKIQGGWSSANGGGVLVTGANASFTMNGGEISFNTAGYGGGVYVENGTFILNGGKIYNNTATLQGDGIGWGGGVYNKNGAFTMTGGTISGNRARSCGGGVFNGDADNVSSTAVFTMTGGEIRDNMFYDGSISTLGEHGGGVFNRSVFNLSGMAKIYFNYEYASDQATQIGIDNLYLASGKLINILDTHTGTVYVNTEATPEIDTPVVITSGWTSASTCRISLDNAKYVIGSDSSLQKTVAVPIASVTYDGVETRFANFSEAWNNAVNWSSKYSNRVTFKLFADWTAKSGSFGTGSGFGINGNSSNTGNIYVPSGKYINIDLNGKTIDRALTTAQADGYLLRVDGNLILTDSSSALLANQGKLTGGYSSGNGGAVVVTGVNAYFTMNGGSIIGNTANSGGGVYVESGSAVLSGGAISGNNASELGGGLYVATDKVSVCGAMTITDNFKNGTFDSVTKKFVVGSNGEKSNVYLTADKAITIGNGDGTTDSNDVFSGLIGVSVEKMPQTTTNTTVAKGFKASGSYVDTGSFVSDNYLKVITTSSGDVQLGRYTITYYDLGSTDGTAYSGNAIDESYKYVVNGMTLPVGTKTGYSVYKWYTDKEGTKEIASVPVDQSADLTVYASWQIIPATAPTFTTAPKDTTVAYNNSVTLSVVVAEVSGHTYTYQWYSNSI